MEGRGARWDLPVFLGKQAAAGAPAEAGFCLLCPGHVGKRQPLQGGRYF